MSESFHVNFSISDPMVPEKKSFKIFSIEKHVKTISPDIVAPHDPQGPWEE
jgi:hypothetical protein